MSKQVPLSLTEDFVSEADAAEDEILGEIRDVLRASREAAEHALDGVKKVKANVMNTAAQNAKQARELAWKFFEHAAVKIDRSRERCDRTVEKIQRDIAAPSVPTGVAGVMLHGEIRAALARMTHEQRSKVINDAIESGDEDSVETRLCGAQWRSGLDGHGRGGT
jgi:hypothetical protein